MLFIINCVQTMLSNGPNFCFQNVKKKAFVWIAARLKHFIQTNIYVCLNNYHDCKLHSLLMQKRTEDWNKENEIMPGQNVQKKDFINAMMFKDSYRNLICCFACWKCRSEEGLEDDDHAFLWTIYLFSAQTWQTFIMIKRWGKRFWEANRK